MLKIKQLILCTAIVLLFAACDDELNQLPETRILADNYYTTETNVETTVTAAYNSLQELYNYYMILWGEIPSDNTYVQAPNTHNGVSPLETFTWTSTTGFASSIWENSYEGILYANTVLNVIDVVEYDSETTRSVRKGEMKFIRGLLYHNLSTIYGAVPLVIEIDDPTNAFDDARTPLDKVYAQIEEDLTDAIDLLPTTNSTGRVNKYGAEAILAKHYMTLQEFSKAETLLASIISSGKFDLVDLDKLYGVENEGSSEDVFSVQFASDLDSKSEGNSYYYNFTQPDDEGGAGAMAMESSLYERYDLSDRRRELINKSGNTYYINKWTKSPSSSVGDGGDNHYVVRYADVLLLYAECLNENGETSEAVTYLNMIRKRAGLDDTAASTQSAVRDAIAQERRFEFVGEGHRWCDLLRTKTAIETMDAFFESEGSATTVESFRLLAPIPQSEIDITKMEQNPGY